MIMHNGRQIEQLIPDEIAQYRGHARRSAAGSDDDGEYDDLYDDFKPGDDVHIKTYGDVGAAKVVSVKGTAQRQALGCGLVQLP